MPTYIHTICQNNTMSEIAEDYGFEPGEWEEKIWNHPYNQIIRKFWPLGTSTTPRQLPVGYTIFIPFTAVINDTVDEPETHRSYVYRRNLVGDLHLKINYFREYATYGWWPEHFNIGSARDEPADAFGQLGGETYANLLEGNPVAWNQVRGVTYDRERHEYITTIMETRDAQSDTIQYGDTLVYPDMGQYGVVQGDPNRSDQMEDGYIYVFMRPSPDQAFELEHTFKVFNGIYQPVQVTAGDDSHETSAGAAQSYAIIPDFFPEEPRDETLHKQTFVITSDIPLSGKTLFEGEYALVNRAHQLGSEITDRAWMLENKDRFPESGDSIQSEFETADNRTPAADPRIRNMIPARIGDKQGFYLVVPNTRAEAVRRAEGFREKLDAYLSWREGETRSKKAFIWGVVSSLLDNNSLKYAWGLGLFGEIDRDKFNEFEEKETNDVKAYYLPAKYATLHLIAWLQDERFKQLIRNYSHRFDTPAPFLQPDYQDQLLTILNDVFSNLNLTEEGNQYFAGIWDDADSFYHLLLNTEQAAGIDYRLKKNPSAPDVLTPLRKVNGAVMEFMEHFVPVLAKQVGPRDVQVAFLLTAQRHFKEVHDVRIVEWVMADGTHKFLLRSEIPLPSGPSLQYEAEITLYNIHNERWYQRMRATGSVLGKVLEMVNVCAAVTALAQNQDKERVSELFFAAIGAFADLIVEFARDADDPLPWNLSQKFAPFRFLNRFPRVGPIACIISGVIGFVLSIQHTIDEIHRGNYGLALGYGMMGVSSLLSIAAGMIWLKAGTVSAAGGFFLGSAICGAIGGIVLLIADTAVENWGETCFLGKNAGDDLDRQISSLMRILCTFGIEGPTYEDAFDLSEYGSRYVLVMNPNGLITPDSTIELSRLSIRGHRIFPSGRSEHFEQSLPSHSFTLDQEATGQDFTWHVIRDQNNLITRIGLRFYFRDFVDDLSGTITLRVRNSALQRNLPEHMAQRYRSLVYSKQF
ncbi:MAG: hypothetical protein MJE63_01005 [Proteobacteria bacterium]|nr:hypothetical protein [Pseudomonadota bacterium]